MKNGNEPVGHVLRKPSFDVIFRICQLGNIPANHVVCTSPPYDVHASSSYVIDLKSVKYKDLTTDGVIYDKNSRPTTQIFIGINDGEILSHTRNSDDATPDHNKYFYKRYYSSKSVNGYTLHRQIHSFVKNC